MTLLKGLVASAVGLFSVIMFCGSVSGVVLGGVSEFYALYGSILPSRVLFCTIWFVFFLLLALFIGIFILNFSSFLDYALLFIWGVLHTFVVILTFKFSEYLFALVLLFLIIIIYLWFLWRFLRKSPKITLLFLPYLGWLGYLFAILYSITLIK